jgi:hypothetical protein
MVDPCRSAQRKETSLRNVHELWLPNAKVDGRLEFKGGYAVKGGKQNNYGCQKRTPLDLPDCAHANGVHVCGGLKSLGSFTGNLFIERLSFPQSFRPLPALRRGRARPASFHPCAVIIPQCPRELRARRAPTRKVCGRGRLRLCGLRITSEGSGELPRFFQAKQKHVMSHVTFFMRPHSPKPSVIPTPSCHGWREAPTRLQDLPFSASRIRRGAGPGLGGSSAQAWPCLLGGSSVQASSAFRCLLVWLRWFRAF